MHTGQREHLPERVSTKDAHRIVGPTVLPVQVFLGESESLLLSHQLRTSVFKGEAHVPPLHSTFFLSLDPAGPAHT